MNRTDMADMAECVGAKLRRRCTRRRPIMVAAEREALVVPEGDAQCSHQDERWLSRESVAELVSKVPVFQRVASERESFSMQLGDRCIETPVAAGPIFLRGDVGEDMYFIVDGVVSIHLELHIESVAELRAGDILGEGALLINAPRSACAVASEGTRLLRLPKTALEEVLPLYPAVEHELAEFAMGRLTRPSSRLAGASLWTRPMPKRPRGAERLHALDIAKGAITQQPKAIAQRSGGGGVAQNFSDLTTAEKQRYQDLAREDVQRYQSETAATGGRHAFRMMQYRDPAALKAAAVCLVAPVVGVLPFLVPLSGDARRCRLGDDFSATVSCKTVEPIMFTFVVLPIWLLLCAGWFLELMEIQFRRIGFDEEDDAAAHAGHRIGFAGSFKQQTLIIVGSQGTCAVCLGLLLPAITGADIGGDLGTLAAPGTSRWVLNSWWTMMYIIVILCASWPVWFVIFRLIYRTSKKHELHQEKKALTANQLKASHAMPAVQHIPSVHGIVDMLHHHAMPPVSPVQLDSDVAVPGDDEQNELDDDEHSVAEEAVVAIPPPLARAPSSRKHKRRRKALLRCCAKATESSAKAVVGATAEVFDATTTGDGGAIASGSVPDRTFGGDSSSSSSRARINLGRLEADGAQGIQFHSFLTKARLHSWREESHHGTRARTGMLRGFAWWTLGLILMICNWLGLIVFFSRFSEAISRQGDDAAISSWGFLFDVSQFVMMTATVKVLKMGEQERVGTSLTTFDRFHLVNLGE